MAIYFIRHGQSEFNAAFQGDIDPLIFDAPLTQLGFEQASEARKTIAELEIKRVIASPLTRALQTANTIFDGIAPIEVRHGHHELLKYSGDVGRHPDALSVDFPDLSFGHLPPRWWYPHEGSEDLVPKEPEQVFQNRIANFVETLATIESENVAIVGHGNAFQEVIGFMLQNCQIHQYR
ncbi:histidine phosphatase family protein [Sulfitobacter sp. SK012]|uniref:histidine phosphatase family protein n=1 Tax=Sulfitobacter sp. SK012 TaxID=1389005 RepID=UPI000E0B0FEE|nr:histidine phosphatase family protein [Sulfitobacter sp. SK012]AXI47803.1 histidine phosphatase family protein [Sulfitobacter sp. SK012]